MRPASAGARSSFHSPPEPPAEPRRSQVLAAAPRRRAGARRTYPRCLPRAEAMRRWFIRTSGDVRAQEHDLSWHARPARPSTYAVRPKTQGRLPIVGMPERCCAGCMRIALVTSLLILLAAAPAGADTFAVDNGGD